MAEGYDLTRLMEAAQIGHEHGIANVEARIAGDWNFPPLSWEYVSRELAKRDRARGLVDVDLELDRA